MYLEAVSVILTWNTYSLFIFSVYELLYRKYFMHQLHWHCMYLKLIIILLDYTLDYFSFIIDGCKFTSIAQTVTKELTYGLHVRGITPLRKLNNFSHLIMCSVWTLDVATHLVAVDAHADTLFLRIIGGAISTVSCRAKRSCMFKPSSAITESPGLSFSRETLTLTISLSLILSLYNFETILKCKIGDIHVSNLNVFEDLCWLYYIPVFVFREPFNMFMRWLFSLTSL